MGDRERNRFYYERNENDYETRDPYRDYGRSVTRDAGLRDDERQARDRDERERYDAGPRYRDEREGYGAGSRYRDERESPQRAWDEGQRPRRSPYGGSERVQGRDWEPGQRWEGGPRDERTQAYARGERPYGFDRPVERWELRGYGQERAWYGTDRYGVPLQESYLQRAFERNPYEGENGDYRGRERARHEGGWGEQLREAGQRVARKVKRVFRGPKGYKRADDRIREDVCDRLAEQDQFDPSEIEVNVANGDVTLGGSVQSRHDKFLAEELADDVSGVNDVHNQLRVRREQSAPSNTVFGEPTTATAATANQNQNTAEAQRRNARA